MDLHRSPGSDTLIVQERIEKPLPRIDWGDKSLGGVPTVEWRFTRYTYLGKRGDGSLDIREEVSYK
ncbi:hypothetical protein HYX00_05670 [Candidatus Woesearchaeota archaeon]|nr:hypothetical protein [Candidatus Woesearchaeota archaeon]